jgi:hypothetical protein
MPISSDKLANARKAFSLWRNQSNRKRIIPDQLWLQAISLLDLYSISRVATELGLNQSRLREKQAAFKQPQPLKNLANEQTSFLELNQFLPAASAASVSSTVQLQIERVDGTRLTLSLDSSQSDTVQNLVTTFIRS